MIQYLGIIWITWSFLRRCLNEQVALLACLLIATVPLFPIFASVVFTETTELFYVALSFWLFHGATLRDRKILWLFGAGLSAGLGWLTRETTAALLLFYGILFLIGFGIPRRYYWIMAGGFLLVAGAEALIMATLTGDPLYRYEVVLSKQGNIHYKGGVEGDVFNRIGNFSVHPAIDPILVLFANHEFSLLFYVAIPAAIWCWHAPNLPAQQRNILRLLLTLAVLWFFFVSIMLTNLHQRYYTVCAYAAVILVAAWLVYGLPRISKRLPVLVLVTLFGANFFAIYIDNPNQLFGERSLVKFIESSEENIHTDPFTLRRASFFLSNAGFENRVNSSPPTSQSLFFYNPKRAATWIKKNPGSTAYLPDASWELIWENSEGRKISGIVLEQLGLNGSLPPSIYRRLNMPNEPVAVYRVP
jgi:4-amino-4-deoxy-L-arabinose transferase-like glycosyltransferase